MFKVTDEHFFWWPATARMPDPSEHGKFKDHTFKLYFRELEPEAIADIEREAVRQGKPVERFLLMAVVRGWEGIVNKDETPIGFSDLNLAEALRFSAFRLGAFKAYRDAMNGEAARLGN